nr:hypothetical protein [Bariatricus massiliensis]
MNEKIRKYLLPNLPYLMVFWFFAQLGEAYRLAAGADFAHKLIGMVAAINPALQTIGLGLAPLDWLVGLAGAVTIRLVVYSKVKKSKKFRRDLEYGSARWSA